MNVLSSEPSPEDWLLDPIATLRALDCVDARDSLHTFCGMIEIPGAPIDDDADAEGLSYKPIKTPQAAHHRLLLDKLEAVERGEIRRLMVFMPPGSAKSTYASVVFPPWFMGRKRRRNVIVATYAADLGRKIGRRMRSIVKQGVYREIFDTGLSLESSAADEWALDNGNEFMSGGILSGITGNRADGLIIDDPVKGRQEADSEVIQERTKSEFEDSLKTRLKPGGWIILIQTRWSENDLAGQILPEGWDGESGEILCRDGQTWEVLCIPAQAEENDPLGRKPGEMLWAEWFDAEHWANYRGNSRTWSALYQQRPAPDDGSFFRREWFRRYRPGSQPKNLRVYLSSDHAPAEGEENDPSGCRAWGLDPNNDLYLLDGFQHRADMSRTADRIIGLMRKWSPFAWFPEDDNNWKSAAPFIKLRMRQLGVFTRIEPMSPHGQDKASKAQSAQGMAANGMVWIPEGPEGDAIIDQYVKFPAGAHDDEVDMIAIMGRAIAMAHPAIAPPVEADPKPIKGLADTTYDELLAQQRPSGRERIA
jgi:predicted phage terminase large subunit-like protein